MKAFVVTFVLMAVFPFVLISREPFWDKVAAPEIGEVVDMAVDKSGDLFITSLNGLFKSTNSGESWVKIPDSNFVSDKNGSAYFSKIEINDRDEIIVYNDYTQDDLFFSSDRGKSWKRWHTPWKNSGSVDFDWDNKGNLYCLTASYENSGLFYSSNLDTNWKKIDRPFTSDLGMFLSVYNDSCFAVLNNGLWHDTIQTLSITTDRGNTWNDLEYPQSRFSTIKFQSKDEVFLGSYDGLFLLKNGKDLVSFGLDTIGGVIDIYMPERKYIYLGTCNNFTYMSTDSGKTWIYVNMGKDKYPEQRFCKIRKDNSGDLFAKTWLLGIYRSTDNGQSWKPANKGFFSSMITGIAFDKHNNAYAACNGLFKSTDNGISWFSIGIEGATYKGVFVSSKNYLYSSSWDLNALIRSKDEGRTWDTLPYNTFDKMLENKWGHLFATSGTSICRSTDNGQSWRYLNIDSKGSEARLSINSEGDLFYIDESPRIQRSINNGDSWETVFYDSTVYTGYANSISFYPNSKMGFTGLYTLNLYTTDNGRSWLNLYDKFPDSYFGDPSVIDSSYSLLWNISPIDSDIFVRTDQYANVIDTVSSPRIFPYYNQIVTSPDGYIWGLSDYRGIVRSRNKYVSVEENVQQDLGLTLSNSPNPFSTVTDINFSIPQPGFVSITVTDILGQVVYKSLNEFKDSGSYSFRFDSNDLSSGVYFCTLEHNGKKVTHLLNILK